MELQENIEFDMEKKSPQDICGPYWLNDKDKLLKMVLLYVKENNLYSMH